MGVLRLALLTGIAAAALGIASADVGSPAQPATGDTPAPVDPAALDATFANTVEIKNDDEVTLAYFNRDGTFTARGSQGDAFGTWRFDGNKICTRTKAGGDSCGIVQPGRKVGDKWTQRIEGETYAVKIIAGR